MSEYRTLGTTVPVASLFDVAAWRRNYAWGIPLVGDAAFTPKQQLIEACDRAGEQRAQIEQLVAAIPDSVILHHLRAAASELEMKLQIQLGVLIVKSHPVDEGLIHGRDYDRVDPRLPYIRQDARSFYRLDLPYSVLSVQRVRGYYFNQKIIEVSPTEGNIGNVVVEFPKQGVIRIMPTNMGSLIVGQGYAPTDYALSLWELVWNAKSVPDFWAVDYVTGPCDQATGTPGMIEAVLAHWVALRAGKLLINMAGTAYGQGVVSTSISTDGFSRSVTTSQSAMYSINSAMEIVFQSYTDSIDWKALRTYKRGLKVYGFTR